MITRWIAWRTEPIGPNGRPWVEFLWHRLAEGTRNLATCGDVPPADVQLCRYMGTQAPGPTCIDCREPT